MASEQQAIKDAIRTVEKHGLKVTMMNPKDADITCPECGVRFDVVLMKYARLPVSEIGCIRGCKEGK